MPNFFSNTRSRVGAGGLVVTLCFKAKGNAHGAIYRCLLGAPKNDQTVPSNLYKSTELPLILKSPADRSQNIQYDAIEPFRKLFSIGRRQSSAFELDFQNLIEFKSFGCS